MATLAVLASIVLLHQPAAFAGPPSPAGVFDCHRRTVRVIFRSGPDAIVEVYAGTGRSYQPSLRLASVTVDGVDVAKKCTNELAGQGSGTVAQMRTKRRGASPIAIECTADTSLRLRFLDYGTAPDMVEQRGVLISTTRRNVMYGIVGTRSEASNEFDRPIRQFDAAVCRRVPLPRP